jgi:hypothetical protein
MRTNGSSTNGSTTASLPQGRPSHLASHLDGHLAWQVEGSSEFLTEGLARKPWARERLVAAIESMSTLDTSMSDDSSSSALPFEDDDACSPTDPCRNGCLACALQRSMLRAARRLARASEVGLQLTSDEPALC